MSIFMTYLDTIFPVEKNIELSAILRYHNIGYHVYADDTQLYV